MGDEAMSSSGNHGQQDLFPPHTRSRWSDPDTSHGAAEQVADKMTERRTIVLAHFVKHGSMTDLELQQLCADHGSTYRTRRSELVEMGFVADTGRRKPQHGSNRIVWVITEQGLRAARVFCGVK